MPDEYHIEYGPRVETRETITPMPEPAATSEEIVRVQQVVLAPGSDEAARAVCLCPRMDNGYGRGYMGMPGVYVQREDCPLHGSKRQNEKLSD